jgi:F-type H+-transporting ATPase subunit a
MGLGDITPDETIYWSWRFVHLNATIVFTWITMIFLAVGSWLVTRNLSDGPEVSRWQHAIEAIVDYMRQQIREISQQAPDRYLVFIGGLFLFVAVSNALTVVPGYIAPTGSLSATAALALCVLVAVPIYGVASTGLGAYLRNYVRPNPIMLPFNVIGELSRTLALAVRLFGNVMSGAKIGAILITLTPLFFPVVMNVFGLLTGLIQAYIFAILAMVYIAAATRAKPQDDAGRTTMETTPETTPNNGSAEGEQ